MTSMKDTIRIMAIQTMLNIELANVTIQWQYITFRNEEPCKNEESDI